MEETQTFWYALQPKNVPHIAFLRLPLIEHAFDISPTLTAEYIVPTCEITLIKQSLLWVKMGYKKEFQESIENPEKFWRKQAELIKWYEFPNSILSEDENGFTTGSRVGNSTQVIYY